MLAKLFSSRYAGILKFSISFLIAIVFAVVFEHTATTEAIEDLREFQGSLKELAEQTNPSHFRELYNSMWEAQNVSYRADFRHCIEVDCLGYDANKSRDENLYIQDLCKQRCRAAFPPEGGRSAILTSILVFIKTVYSVWLSGNLYSIFAVALGSFLSLSIVSAAMAANIGGKKIIPFWAYVPILTPLFCFLVVVSVPIIASSIRLAMLGGAGLLGSLTALAGLAAGATGVVGWFLIIKFCEKVVERFVEHWALRRLSDG
jgi:hypothetical protein